MYAKALILALAGSAIATPALIERQLSAVNSALAGVNTASTALDNAVKSFSGAGDVAGLTTAAGGLLTAINTANSQIAAAQQLSISDALGLQSSSAGLVTQAQTLVNDIIAKKPAFDAVCASGAVLQQLQQQKTASGTLANTIVSKLPDALQSIGASQSGGVTDAVQKGIDAYQGSPTSCATTGSGSGASSGSSGSSAAGSAPSSAAAASAPASAAASAAPSSGASSGSAPSSAPVASASATASTTPKSTPTGTPTPSITPYTGAAAPKGVATGFFGVAAVAAVFAVAL